MIDRQKVFAFLGAVAVGVLLTACGQDLAGAAFEDGLQRSAVQTAVIDFEGLSAGSIVSSLSSGNGISGDPFSGSVGVYGDNGVHAANAAMVFDATCGGGPAANCTGDDPDLFQEDLGNVLIVSEDLDGSDPDDSDNAGAELRFDFTGFGPGSFTIVGLTILDIDDDESPGANIKVYAFYPGGSFEQFDIPDIGDGNAEFVPIGAEGVSYLIVHLHGSGAVDNLTLSAEDPRDPQGCTPGYWRQPHHYDSWEGHLPSDLYSSVFGVGPDTALGQTIKARGGGVNAFLLASTAALLNAAHSELAYAYTSAELSAIVTAAFESGDFSMAETLDDANNAGCTLN